MVPSTGLSTFSLGNLQPSIRRLLVMTAVVVSWHARLFSLDCPKQPEQMSKDSQVEVNASVAKIWRLSGADAKVETKKTTQDLMGKLPSPDRVYLEQMMYASYCSLLRDAKNISDEEKLKRLDAYNAQVRRTVTQQSANTPPKAPVKPAPASHLIEPKVERFGLTLGWELGRYEFVDGSDFPEAAAAAPKIQEDIRSLLEQDGFPQAATPVHAQDLMHKVVMYYGSKDTDKLAMILFGIAAMRASLIGASRDPANNEAMRKLAQSAIEEIDSSILPNKEMLFREVLTNKPTNVAGVIELLNKHRS